MPLRPIEDIASTAVGAAMLEAYTDRSGAMAGRTRGRGLVTGRMVTEPTPMPPKAGDTALLSVGQLHEHLLGGRGEVSTFRVEHGAQHEPTRVAILQRPSVAEEPLVDPRHPVEPDAVIEAPEVPGPLARVAHRRHDRQVE